MITLALARDTFRHMQWADAEIWRAIDAVPAASSDQKLMAILLHLHAVQRAFYLMWTNSEIDPEALYAARDVDTLRAWARSYYADADAFLAQTSSDALNDIVVMPWLQYFAEQLGRPLQAPTLADTLVQLPAHSTYHRGQINARLREVGGEPPLVDYIAWVWFGRPEPAW
ncbi:MAG TPA: DinB family protein [Thermoanaerobaculia bacterium]|nr:DinB family protein [Thermoanaerobaculia bacterium]